MSRTLIFLMRHLKLQTAKHVLGLVGKYYPANRIPVKTQNLDGAVNFRSTESHLLYAVNQGYY